MHSDEALAFVMDECEQVCFLGIIHAQIAIREEHDGIESIEVLCAPLERFFW